MRLVRGGASRVRKTKSSSKKQQRADKKNNKSKIRAHEIFSFEELLGHHHHPTDDILSVDVLLIDDQHLDCTDDPEVFSVEELLVQPTDDHLEFMLYVDDQHSDRSDDPELLFSENELLVDVAVAEEKAFGDDIQLQLQEEDQEIIDSFMACFDDHDQLQ